MILNGTLTEAKYFANEVSKVGAESHIWLHFECTDDTQLVVFVYPSGQKTNILYPASSSTLGAQVSVSESLFDDLKAVVTNQASELEHVGIVIGSGDLSDDLLVDWFPPDDYQDEEKVEVDEFSITFSHPAYTSAKKRILESTEELMQRTKDFTEELQSSYQPDPLRPTPSTKPNSVS